MARKEFRFFVGGLLGLAMGMVHPNADANVNVNGAFAETLLEGESLHVFAENHEDLGASVDVNLDDPLDRPPATPVVPNVACKKRRQIQTGATVCSEFKSPAYPSRAFEAAQWGEWKEAPWNQSMLRGYKMKRYGYNWYRYVLMYDHFEDQPWMRVPNLPSFVECRASDRLPVADASFSFRKTETWKSRVGLAEIDLVVAKLGADIENSQENDQYQAVKINGWATGKYAIHTPELRTMTERGIIYIQTYNADTKTFGFLSKADRYLKDPDQASFTWRNMIDAVPVVGGYLELKRSYDAWRHYPEIFNRTGANPVFRLKPYFVDHVPEECRGTGVNNQALRPEEQAHSVTGGGSKAVTTGETYSTGITP
jgi:hypothetical protein